MSFDVPGGQSCCQVEMESEKSTCDGDKEDTKGCCDTVCDCLCCGHIFTFNKTKKLLLSEPIGIIHNQPAFSFSYFHNFNIAIWQPPRLI